ncbi:hypothetical protein I302_102638 [Kwoniella bestiolae CBS 10118]|uniref:ATP-dependent DNA helicase n=1 Tax=Kwoniella bestiolae CBS 10118 TaxID=1296100 RepID=A0A1B9GFI6_9TREE|nr:hypothetical protein I302_01327 [Kwoniella bestiolae CBS 10118]OCF29814.1 hypothetical protein I302_01327 [Kwoniella bestiolae CBS 10118]
MSDDDFGDDSFLVDDSFLREVDHITASASVPPQPKTLNNGFTRSVSLSNPRQAPAPAKGWTGVQRSASGPSSKPLQKINSTPLIPSSFTHNQNKAPTLNRKLPTQPSSDDYDIIPLEPESLAALDSLTSRQNQPHSSASTSTSRVSTNSAPVIPFSRTGLGRVNGTTTTTNVNNGTFGRTNSNNSSSNRPNNNSTSFGRTNSNGFLQTHLNFRKEKQTTKGKIWDRTEFAQTGRRIGTEKGKGKNKKAQGKRKSRDWEEDEDGEDEDLEEDDWGDALAPPPKPLVDMNAPYEPPRHLPNSATIQTYIYPTNRPKRDYQYEIIKACFKDNCLVALPTGLGKTFVAGVVMLNFYRWFPTGKIVFLAPTKPLVNQQIEACQLSCGIPSKDAAVMTGSSVSQKERARLWEDRRVFYCTPQTLDNDLKKGSVDPRDIVLAVFDEAHKASGGYAYTTILAYITAHHPYFRVLALTATPGADVPRVQSVVDALHISRIEIREAEAPEIRKYMNEKRTEKHVVAMGEIIEGFRDRWAALMRPNVAKLVDKDILTERDLDCKRLRPFRLTAKRMEIARDRNSGLKWAFGSLTALEKMARAMGHLLEFSLGMFHTILVEIAGGTDASGKKSNTKGSANSMRNNTEFQKLLRDVEIEMNMIRIGKDGRTKADKHPKMQRTLELLLAHFTQAEEEEQTLGQKNDTRAMVFCSFRECVLDVVDMLNQHSGLLRATKFVGQSQGKQEADKGFNQKEQKKTINEFKDGKYNILVSTSIGEEGLDIGEVDFVVIYDMPKQSIKLLQRVGRTGRKRDGKVHVLMSENREDMNWETAQQTHRDIQEEILHSRNLELFEDVEPLIPDGQFPECVEQEMEIDPWDPDDKKFQKTLAEAEKLVRKEKEKRETALLGATGRGKGKAKDKDKGRGHEVPEGAEGFKSVADLLRDAGKLPSSTKKKGKRLSPESEAEGEDGEDRLIKRKQNSRKRGREPSPVQSESDESEEQDLDSLFAQTGSKKAGSRSNAKKKVTKRSRKSTEKSTSQRKNTHGASLADIDLHANSDSASEVELPSKKVGICSKAARKKEVEQGEIERKAEQAEKDQSALDFFHAIGSIQKDIRRSPIHIAATPTPPSSPPPPARKADIPSSPEVTKVPSMGGQRLTPRTAAAVGFSQIAPVDLSWDMDMDMDVDMDMDEELISPVLRKTPQSGTMLPPPIPSTTSKHASSPLLPSGLVDPNSPLLPTQPVRRLGLRRPRPPMNNVLLSSGSKDSPFPVRPAGGRRMVVQSSEPDSPVVGRRQVVVESSSPVVERRRERTSIRERESGDQRKRSKKNKGPIGEYLDMDAALSGSDSGDSSEHSDSSVASSSDLRFAGNFQPTQAPRGYNQQAIYLAGLGTQARGHGLNFRRDIGDAKKDFLAKARKAVYITDDEDDDAQGLSLRGSREARGRGRVEQSSENEYELGSFVVDDDDDD